MFKKIYSIVCGHKQEDRIPSNQAFSPDDLLSRQKRFYELHAKAMNKPRSEPSQDTIIPNILQKQLDEGFTDTN